LNLVQVERLQLEEGFAVVERDTTILKIFKKYAKYKIKSGGKF
jgi:hypothetical protein